VPKHVVVPYVDNTLYSTNKYSCVRPVHTLYVSYFIEHNGDDEPHENNKQLSKHPALRSPGVHRVRDPPADKPYCFAET
jgi:hypothetical protein